MWVKKCLFYFSTPSLKDNKWHKWFLSKFIFLHNSFKTWKIVMKIAEHPYTIFIDLTPVLLAVFF